MDLIEKDEEAQPVESLNQPSDTMGEKLAKFLLAKYQNAPTEAEPLKDPLLQPKIINTVKRTSIQAIEDPEAAKEEKADIAEKGKSMRDALQYLLNKAKKEQETRKSLVSSVSSQANTKKTKQDFIEEVKRRQSNAAFNQAMLNQISLPPP